MSLHQIAGQYRNIKTYTGNNTFEFVTKYDDNKENKTMYSSKS